MLKDIRQAVRLLTKDLGFTAIAVCSLAIGIGANSAIFSFADGLLLRPLPVMKPSSVVAVNPVSSGAFGGTESLSYPDYRDLRDRNRSFDGLVAFGFASYGYAADARALPARKFGSYVSGNFFRVMGVEPSLGRGFRPDEDKVAGRDAVVVLGHDMWVSDFGGSRSAIGSKLRLNGVEFTVIGVAPEQFTGVNHFLSTALYVPIAMWPRLNQGNILADRNNRWVTVKGRLKPGVTVTQAEADISAMVAALRQMYPQADRDLKLRVQTELQLRVAQDPPDAAILGMLMALALCVLLVACANVAGLLLSRSRARSREIAVRLAIGASRWQLIRQLLLENLVLALAGGVLGLGVAYGGVQFFNNLPKPTDIPIAMKFQLDDRVLAFTMAVSVLSTLLFGLAPAIRSSRPDVISALKARDANQGGGNRFWGRNILVSGQVALSLVLLIVSAVLLQGFRELLGAGPGYRTQRLFLTSFDPSLLHYTADQTQQFYGKLLQEVRSAPGVRSATVAYGIPMAIAGGNLTFVPEDHQLAQGVTSLDTFDNTVGDEYFETMHIPILRGRGLERSDIANTRLVAVVNEHFAAHYWPGQDALGKRIHLTSATGPLVEIVGIAKMSKYLWIAEPPLDFVYLPLTQNPQSEMTLIAETRSEDASAISPALREIVRKLDPNMPAFGMRTMQELYDQRAVKTPNMILGCVAAMGLLGLTLAMVGLYGLLAYAVSRRAREIGIRMAVGADRPSVLSMMIKQGFRLGLAGVVIGTVASVFACRLIESTMVMPSNAAGPLLFATVSIPLLLVTMLASYVPARRASLIDPMRALHDE